MDTSETTNRSQNVSILANQRRTAFMQLGGCLASVETDFNRQQGEREERAGVCAGMGLIHADDTS